MTHTAILPARSLPRLILAVAFVLGALAPGVASDHGAHRFSPACTLLGQAAYTMMEARQNRLAIGMATDMAIESMGWSAAYMSGTRDMLRKIAVFAYREPRGKTERQRRQAAEAFRTRVANACRGSLP